MKKLLNRKGQFSIISALLVAIVLVTTVIMTYSIIRDILPKENPKVLNATDEVNLSLKRVLGFAVGYYGSVLQVTGNTTYAKELTSAYIKSGLNYIAESYSAWNPSFNISYGFYTKWYEKVSYSVGNINVNYSLPTIGIYGIRYATSAALNVTILETKNNETKLRITKDDNQPELSLTSENFFFYSYSYVDSAWKLVSPAGTPILVNETYILQIPSSVDKSSFFIQVRDLRGIMVTAFYSVSGRPQYTYTFSWNQTLYSSLTKDTVAVEVLQNGTLRWLGQNLLTYGKPIPPVPVKALHVNQTTFAGVNREVPFQVEDWASRYQIPLGLSNNMTIFSNRQMLVFLVNHNVKNVTIWWDGRDTAKQTPLAYTNKHFTVDTAQRRLSNGNLTIQMDFSAGAGGVNSFKVISTLGASTSTAEFMRLNNEVAHYGHAEPNYAIRNGPVRCIVLHEGEWDGNGAPNSPNVYQQIILTLPANATYYTYALRMIFVDSTSCPVNRVLNDLSPIQLYSGWKQGLRVFTENGTNGGVPIVVETLAGTTNVFYNYSKSVWAHHWSQYAKGSTGVGIMFTDNANMKLYAFDNIVSQKTGALNVTNSERIVWTKPAAVYSRCGADGNYPATRAIDGDTTTSWRHSTSENHWIILDLGESINISRIRIYQHTSTSTYRWGYPDGIEVYVSDNPNSWGSAVWVGTLNSGGWQESGPFNKKGRYVRLYSRSTSSSQRLYEVQVEVKEARAIIEFNPIERFSVAFKFPLDITWYGAVVNFDATDMIYPANGGNSGLWLLVEKPPTVTVS